MDSKIKVFINSSDAKPSLEFAQAVGSRLSRDKNIECTHHVDVRKANATCGRLDLLLDVPKTFTVAVFAFSPDDTLEIRGKNYQSVRDTLMFEFGVLLGRMGRDNVFVMGPKDAGAGTLPQLRTISDLQGITIVSYDSTGSIAERIEKPCQQISSYIQQRRDRPDLAGEILRDFTDIQRIIQEVKGSVRTRYVSEFPRFFETHVLECAENPDEHFYVACDVANYGSFTANDTYRELVALLKSKQKGKVHALFLSDSRQRAITRLQVPKDWQAEIAKPDFRQRLEEFEDREQVVIDSAEAFERQLNVSQERALKEFVLRIDGSASELDAPMPVYLWIAEKRKAIFAIPQFGDEFTEHGFETTDAQLIGSLQGLWDRYFQEATRITDRLASQAATAG